MVSIVIWRRRASRDPFAGHRLRDADPTVAPREGCTGSVVVSLVVLTGIIGPCPGSRIRATGKGQTAGSHGRRFRTTTYGGQTAMGRAPARTARHLPRHRVCRRAGHDEYPGRARSAASPD